MRVIVPCCGRSTRYSTERPKWMLPAHDGRPMVVLSTEGLDRGGSELVIAILREHEERFGVVRGLADLFPEGVRVVVLDKPTQSQAETVARTLEALGGGDEAFLVKDADNRFTIGELAQEYNYVCVDSLNNHDAINPRNKSYVQVNHQDLVTNIREKVVVSDLFSVGGYYFRSAQEFRDHFARLQGSETPWRRECYISDIIGSMILEGVPFKARRVSGYQDWGTINEWKRALAERRTFFVLLDGMVFERGGRFFDPRFAAVRPHPGVLESLRQLVAQGHSVVYLSVRPADLADLTDTQLREAGAPPGTVIYGCPTSPWMLVTAPHETLPFQTSAALELMPDDPNLLSKLSGEN